MNSRRRSRKKFWTLIIGLGLTLAAISLVAGTWAMNLNHGIVQRLSERRFSPPTEFYSAPERFFLGQRMVARQIPSALIRLGYRERPQGTKILPGQFSKWPFSICRIVLGENADAVADITQYCLAFRRIRTRTMNDAASEFSAIAVGPDETILKIVSGEPPTEVPEVLLEPELFAQYYGERAILRTEVELGEAPPFCLNALLAIEDAEFLEHRGVSVTGIFRAFIKNVFSGRVRQGGSTITQQLVKNYFLTSERTISRKVKEIVMSILLEAHATKDQILETYINEVYMGQNGPFEVRGFGAAAQHYFNRSLADLDPAECALLAAIVNSPGRFNPFTRPEEATGRRNLVIHRMVALNLIDSTAADSVSKRQLPSPPKRALSEPAPYFVEAVRKELHRREFNVDQGLRVYTTLSIRAQEAAQTSLSLGLEALEKRKDKTIQKALENGKRLEGALVSVNPTTGAVQAIVGGRQFKFSQFNRVFNSQRQVGSLMKPLVYLAALESSDESGRPYSPTSLIPDEKFTVKFDGQKWTPRNYDHKYRGTIPLYYALKDSLNAATSNLALKIGLENVIEISKRLGITSELKPLPSLALGAFEMTPFEIVQVYSTFARLGEHIDLSIIQRVEDLDGKTLYVNEPQREIVLTPEITSVLVSMMKQVFINGTGRGARLMGFHHPAAGKTGTTSDTKDAWFAGFTPHHVAVVWVGYDDASPHGLTGASGALPIWTRYMKQVGAQHPPTDFSWPDSVVVGRLDEKTQESLNVRGTEDAPLEPIDLIFDKSSIPEGSDHLLVPAAGTDAPPG